MNCERLRLNCPGYGRASGQSWRATSRSQEADGEELTNAGIPRRRTYRSCSACRTAKSRCSGARPVCSRCSLKGIDCIYDLEPMPQSASQTSNRQSVSPSRGSEDDVLLAPSATVYEERSCDDDMMTSTPSAPLNTQRSESLSWHVKLPITRNCVPLITHLTFL